MKLPIRQVVIVSLVILLGIWGYIYFAEPWGPGGNGLWTRADHNHDGVVTRDEMELFGNQAAHRNATRLMMHFDAADSDDDNRVTQAEIDVYGTEVGSRDPHERQQRE